MKAVVLFFALVFAAGAVNAADEANGKKVFDKWCVICHGEDDAASGGGTATLKIMYRGTDIPPKLEDRTNLTREFLEVLVRQGRANMPNFRYTEITKSEFNDLVAYLTRNNP